MPYKYRSKGTFGTSELDTRAAAQRARSAAYRERRRASVRSTSMRVQAATMGVPRGVSMEVKSFDVVTTGVAAIPAVGAVATAEPAVAFAGITEVNCVPQGATVANRIGNKIVLRSVHYRASISAAAAVQGEVRLMLVYDRQPNGAFPALTDVLLSQPAGAVNNYSSINIANKNRFLVIRDQFFNLDAAQSLIHHIDWFCKGRWETEFGANAGNIGDFRTGSILFIGYITNAIGGNIVLSNGNCRVRYYD